MSEKSRSERRAARKAHDKELLDKYKDVAPKGPGFSWKAIVIFAVIGILLLMAIVNSRAIYIGTTPIKVLDYSLTRSLKTAGRDINVNIEIDYDTKEDYTLSANVKHTFEYVKALVDMETSDLGKQEFYIDTGMLAVKNDVWEKYDFKQLIIDDKDMITWKPLEAVLDIRSIPAIEDTFEEYAQYFITQYYDRFVYGDDKDIITSDKTYKAKRIDVTLTEEDFYPLIKEFIGFNDNMVDFREGVKDRVKRYLEAVQEYDYYDTANLSEEDVKDYLDNFDENFETTYILFIAALYEYVDDLEAVFEELDVTLKLSFYVDKDYKVREIGAVYDNHKDEDLNSISIDYVVNDFKHGYIENPVEFEETPERASVYLDDLLGEAHPLSELLNNIYQLIFQ